MDRIVENLQRVRSQIAEAAARAGRQADEIQLVAVTKYVGLEESLALIDAGCHHLGESRSQDLTTKAEALRDQSVQWHMIGHLQRNKVRRTLPWVHMVQSLDSVRLAEAIDRIAGELNLPVKIPVLLEVNVSGEASKYGFQPSEMEIALEKLVGFDRLDIRGLMGMAALAGDLDVARRNYATLRQLRDRLRGRFGPTIALDELSMGMSRDFTIAIEQGATIVRIGSTLFDGIRL